MHMHIILCAAAVLVVTESIPVAVISNVVKVSGTTNRTNINRISNSTNFVAVNALRSKRQLPYGGSYQSIPAPGGPSMHTYQFPVSDNVKVGPGIIWNGNDQSPSYGVGFTVEGDGCLYGDDLVLLQNGFRKKLKNLRSGDKIYSVDKKGKPIEDEIIMMLHGGPKVEAPFYTLTTSSNRTISLTGQHLIMKYNAQDKRSQLVAANELKTGDYLLMSDKQQTEPVSIISIELLYKTGIYTPMTYTGTLLVNDIVVSCYVKYFNKYNELHTLLYPVRLYYYFVKDILGLDEEPFSVVPSLVYGDEQFYGTRMIRWLHQSKNMLRFVGQDLLIGTLLSI